MSSTGLGLVGLLALSLILGGMALGHVLFSTAGWPVGLGRFAGLAGGFAISTFALRRAYSSE